MDSQEYRFQRLSKENIHHLVPLFKQVFKKQVSLNFLLGKYDTLYLGKSFLGHIAFDGNRPVAYGGYIPYRIKFIDTVEIGAQSVDSMSLKEISGKGVFKKIYTLNEDLLKSEGINFGYGFANEYSEPVFTKKFGWSYTHRMSVFVIQIQKYPISKIFSKTGLEYLNRMKIQKILTPFLAEGNISSSFSSSQSGFTEYDELFFKYKSYNKHYIIKINGISVWLKIDNDLIIGNMDLCNKSQLNNVITQLLTIGKELGVQRLIFQYSENSLQAQTLAEICKPIRGTSICFKPFSTQLPLDNILFSGGDIDTF